MDEDILNRRQILTGIALTAGTVGLLGSSTSSAAEAAVPDMGVAQAPPISDVKGKVAYVTGASSGIGLGVARVLHEAGAKVVLGYIDDQQIADALKLFPANDPRVYAMKHNVMERDGWERKADEIEKKFGALQILVNNAGVGLVAPATTGTLKDWDWGMGVNFWGPVYGVHTFVPRMLAGKQGCHIVTTTSTNGILLGNGAGIYTVSKVAAVGLMEQLREELKETNIGTSCFVPGLTATNIGRSENYRPESLKNDGPPAAAPGAPSAASGARPPQRPVVPADTPPGWARPQDALVVGRFVLDGILHNDLYIMPAPEYRQGVEARCNAMLESMVPFTPMPEYIRSRSYYRTPIYVQEIAHRRATQKRDIPGT